MGESGANRTDAYAERHSPRQLMALDGGIHSGGRVSQPPEWLGRAPQPRSRHLANRAAAAQQPGQVVYPPPVHHRHRHHLLGGHVEPVGRHHVASISAAGGCTGTRAFSSRLPRDCRQVAPRGACRRPGNRRGQRQGPLPRGLAGVAWSASRYPAVLLATSTASMTTTASSSTASRATSTQPPPPMLRQQLVSDRAGRHRAGPPRRTPPTRSRPTAG
jgi:hypothetical protein